MTIRAIIFDKDGTLISATQAWSIPSIQATDYLLNQSDLAEAKQQEIAKLAGIEHDQLQPNSLFLAGSIRDQAQFFAEYVPLDCQEIEQILVDYYYQFQQQELSDALIEPGVIDLLQTLAPHYHIGLITNDHYLLTHHMLEELKLLDYFDFIGCADQYGPKPNPQALHEFSRRFDIGLHEMVYVGDSQLDMAYGKWTRASIAYDPTGQADYLSDADYQLRHFSELPLVIDAIDEEDRRK
ncbi:HAD family hydrolase [Falseniella ignava]|uniref:HAD hydrolase, family IA n=1 Tax=Falseniella ignava CCUG 37419 TaxID=883112 RepID=K1LVI9_9LACT|nr:HAD family hydrolase [Falseniella ignava]EKB58956.1 HAD hydrolase, family IA [Falseniella ignava CCUG 37419]